MSKSNEWAAPGRGAIVNGAGSVAGKAEFVKVSG